LYFDVFINQLLFMQDRLFSTSRIFPGPNEHKVIIIAVGLYFCSLMLLSEMTTTGFFAL